MFKARSIFTALVIGCAVAAFSALPAAAQTAGNLKCNGCVDSKDIKNRSVKKKDLANNAVTGAKVLNGSITGQDLAPNIGLGRSGDDGDLLVRNSANVTSVVLDGDSANLTNRFINTASQSNGLVKAWAMINEDGTVHACWRCNTDPAETSLIFTGTYEVDFTPLATDISGRPRSATIDRHVTLVGPAATIFLSDRSGDLSTVVVLTSDSDTGIDSDRPFTVMIY